MIKKFLKNKQLVKTESEINLAESYLKKSKSNIITMEILDGVEKYRTLLAIPKDYTGEDWVVVAAYYAMYMAALSLLAKIGYKSRNHTATSAALEEFFVKRNILEKIHFANFENINLRKEEIEILRDVKDRREIAQYSVTKRTTKEMAEKTKSNAREFVDRVEEIFDKL